MDKEQCLEVLREAYRALDGITDQVCGTGFAEGNEFGACMDAMTSIDRALAALAAAPSVQEPGQGGSGASVEPGNTGGNPHFPPESACQDAAPSVPAVYCGCGDEIVPDDGARCGTCVSMKYTPSAAPEAPSVPLSSNPVPVSSNPPSVPAELAVEQVVEIADKYEYRDPESGNLCFDQLGFARGIEFAVRTQLAAAPEAPSAAPHPQRPETRMDTSFPAISEAKKGTLPTSIKGAPEAPQQGPDAWLIHWDNGSVTLKDKDSSIHHYTARGCRAVPLYAREDLACGK